MLSLSANFHQKISKIQKMAISDITIRHKIKQSPNFKEIYNHMKNRLVQYFENGLSSEKIDSYFDHISLLKKDY